MIELSFSRENIERITEILSTSMMNDPLNVSIFPDKMKRKEFLRTMFSAEASYCLEHGIVYATSERMEGIALWTKETSKEKNFGMLIRYGALAVLFKLPVSSIVKLIRYERFAKSIRKRFALKKHWYLHIIAVDAAFRGKGFASKLIKPVMKRLDNDGLSCYLETQNESNVPIYEHYGFRVVFEGDIPGIPGVRHWAMLRD